MTHQSKTRRPRQPQVRAAMCAAHEGDRAKGVALAWCDPETGERIQVEVNGTREWLERLLAAGFVLCEGDPSGEGQAPLYLFREEWPAGTGEKDRGQPLWTGRQLRPALSSNSTHQEKAYGHVADSEH